MARYGRMRPAGMMGEVMRRVMAERYMAARDLRLDAMPSEKQEEVVEAMRQAMAGLRSSLQRRRILCPEWMHALCDD